MARIGNSNREIAEHAAMELGLEFARDGSLLTRNEEKIREDVIERIGFCPEMANILPAFENGFYRGWLEEYHK